MSVVSRDNIEVNDDDSKSPNVGSLNGKGHRTTRMNMNLLQPILADVIHYRKRPMSGNCRNELAKYINAHSSKYIADKDLKEAILDEYPIPNNVLACRKIDPYLKNMLEEQHKVNHLKQQQQLFTLNSRMCNVLGPLSNIWVHMEEEKKFILDLPKE